MICKKIPSITPFSYVDSDLVTRQVKHQPQEIEVDDPQSNCRFMVSVKQAFVMTRAVHEQLGEPVVIECFNRLVKFAQEVNGIDYLQVFKIAGQKEPLWFIEDGEAITALFPSDY
jgi:hypothetical protein